MKTRIIFLSVILVSLMVAGLASLDKAGPGRAVADTIATLTTDKDKYSIGESMTITGADFTPNGPVSVTVLRPDHETDALPEVTTDDSGGFTTTYAPPAIPGRYKITATDGTITAKTAATEADVFGARLDQCRNGGVGETPIDCTANPVGWQNGNAGKENAHFSEGQSIPYRLLIQDTGGLGGSPKIIRVSIQWDTVHSDAMAIDYITYPRRIAENVDPCDGAGVTGIPNCPLEPSTSGAANPAGVNEFDLNPVIGPSGTSPLKSYTTPQMPAGTTGFVSPEPSTSWNAITALEPKAHKIVTIGATIIPGTMAYEEQQDVVSGGSIPSSASSGIQFDISATSNNVVLSWGGHIASRLEWGFLNGKPLSAGGISGSPYHTRLIGACNNAPLSDPCTTGGNQDRSLSAAAVIPPATLTVIKHVINDNGGTAVASAWSIHVKSGSNEVTGSPQAGSETGTTYTPLPAGTYAVSETGGPSGYSGPTFSGDCDSSGNVTLNAGDSKTCTLTNNDVTAHLKLVKVVVNDNGGTKTPANWTLSAAGPTPLSGAGPTVEADVNAGTYNLSENPAPNTAGYASTGYDCGASVTLALGESKTCTITNNDIPGIITIKKVTAGGVGTFDFTVDASGGGSVASRSITTVTPGVAVAAPDVIGLSVGDYVVAEVPKAGWILTASVCEDSPGHAVGTPTGPTPSPGWIVTVPLGGSITCTFENTLQLTTRTQGFWATHLQLASDTWADYLAANGGHFLLCPNKDVNSTPKLMGGFWSNSSSRPSSMSRHSAPTPAQRSATPLPSIVATTRRP